MGGVLWTGCCTLKSKKLNEAIELCNSIPHRLLASLSSNDEAEVQVFLNQAEAGILRVNSRQAYFSPKAPFNGWKVSGRGIAEHGRWDREFYTKVQAVYEK